MLNPALYINRTRFDWHGFVIQIILDGAHTYCVPESLVEGQGTGGIGLCNEFGANEPVGYDEALPGQFFPKLGIGLLKRIDNGPYSSAKNFEVKPFPAGIETNAQSVKFIVDPLPCRGYEVKIEKTVSVYDNMLRVDYKLENVGTKPIITTEYCHNFLGIDGKEIGADYELNYAYNPILDRAVEILTITNGRITWRSTPQEAFYCKIGGFPKHGIQHWELIHKPSKVGLRCRDNVVPARAALWGADHVVSPEVFAEINVLTGQTLRWSREYEFFA